MLCDQCKKEHFVFRITNVTREHLCDDCYEGRYGALTCPICQKNFSEVDGIFDEKLQELVCWRTHERRPLTPDEEKDLDRAVEAELEIWKESRHGGG